jgi:hypothetical protein
MDRYIQLVGKRVEAHYRASDIELSVEGTLVADSAKSVSIEERYTQGGRDKTIRIEIPYDYIIRISEVREKPHLGLHVSPAAPSPAKRNRN